MIKINNNYIKSPLNYVGGKYKLLPQIIPLFPEKIDTFVDLFGGGFNVGINVNANKFIYNDLCTQVVDLLAYMNKNSTDFLIECIDNLINTYSLSKENQQGFLELRDYYNNIDNKPMVFYTMICYAFNYQIRFNKQGKYNMPFGKDRSCFNIVLRQKFIDFVNELHKKDCLFINMDFKYFDYNTLTENDLVYCDPPYFNSTASYNENGGWTQNDEIALLNLLDTLNSKKIKFALSNNLKYNNPLLDEWKNKYIVNYLNYNYSNCNYQKIDKSNDIEVLITNY